MNNIFSRTFFSRPAKKESGFTLIEIVVAMGIVSTLSAIAVPVGMKAHREAVIATVKSDVRSSVDTIMGPDGFSEDSFMAGKAVTAGNNLTLTIDGEGADAVACVWGSHAFGENDVVSFYYSSATGQLNEGTCLGDGTEVLTGVGETTGDAVDAIVDNTAGGITTTSITEPVNPIPSTVTPVNSGVANACSTLSTTLSSVATQRDTEHHDHNHDGRIDEHDDSNHDGRIDEHDHDDERDHNHDGRVDDDDDSNHDGRIDEHDHDDWDYNHDGRVDDDDDENHDGHVDGHEHEHATVTGTVTSNLCGVIVNAQTTSTRHDDDDEDEDSDHHEDGNHDDDDAIQKAANESNVKKFPVCHSVSSGKYKLLMLPIASVTNASWSSGTIIPPITGKYNGKNWDSSGQKTFLKKCA